MWLICGQRTRPHAPTTLHSQRVLRCDRLIRQLSEVRYDAQRKAWKLDGKYYEPKDFGARRPSPSLAAAFPRFLANTEPPADVKGMRPADLPHQLLALSSTVPGAKLHLKRIAEHIKFTTVGLFPHERPIKSHHPLQLSQ